MAWFIFHDTRQLLVERLSFFSSLLSSTRTRMEETTLRDARLAALHKAQHCIALHSSTARQRLSCLQPPHRHTHQPCSRSRRPETFEAMECARLREGLSSRALVFAIESRLAARAVVRIGLGSVRLDSAILLSLSPLYFTHFILFKNLHYYSIIKICSLCVETPNG